MERVLELQTLNIKLETGERMEMEASSSGPCGSSLYPGALPLTLSNSVKQLKFMSPNNGIFGRC